MRLEDAVIAWTPLTWDWHPTTGTIRVGPVKDSDWKREFGFTDGAVWANWKTMSEQDREERMLGIFHQIVDNGHIDPQVAREAFLEIDEYRGLIGRDVPGADDPPA
jgi:hypothetical protein